MLRGSTTSMTQLSSLCTHKTDLSAGPRLCNVDVLGCLQSPHNMRTQTHVYPYTECSYRSLAAQNILRVRRSRLGVAELLHSQLLLQADLLLLLQGHVVEVSSPGQASLQRVSATLPGLMPPPGALQGLAAQVLPIQAHDCPHRVRMRGILRRHAGHWPVVLFTCLASKSTCGIYTHSMQSASVAIDMQRLCLMPGANCSLCELIK